MTDFTSRCLLISLQMLLLVLAGGSAYLLLQDHHKSRDETATFIALQVSVANSLALLNDDRITPEALITALRTEQANFVDQLSLLEFGHLDKPGAALDERWRAALQEVSQASKTAFGLMGDLQQAQEQHLRYQQRAATSRQQVMALNESLTRLFASDLSIDLSDRQLRQVYLIFYQLQALLTPPEAGAAASDPARPAVLAHFDTLLQGPDAIANLALRRHLANLRMRVNEQFDTLESDRPDRDYAAQLRDAQGQMQERVRRLSDALTALFQHYQTAGETRTGLYCLAFVLFVVGQAVLPWCLRAYSAGGLAGGRRAQARDGGRR